LCKEVTCGLSQLSQLHQSSELITENEPQNCASRWLHSAGLLQGSGQLAGARGAACVAGAGGHSMERFQSFCLSLHDASCVPVEFVPKCCRIIKQLARTFFSRVPALSITMNFGPEHAKKVALEPPSSSVLRGAEEVCCGSFRDVRKTPEGT
jgi:hypothetical protein